MAIAKGRPEGGLDMEAASCTIGSEEDRLPALRRRDL